MSTPLLPGLNVFTRPRITVVNLTPRESECGVCGRYLCGAMKGVPMFEGETVPPDWQGDWAGFDACDDCFTKWEEKYAGR